MTTDPHALKVAAIIGAIISLILGALDARRRDLEGRNKLDDRIDELKRRASGERGTRQ